MLPKLRRFAYSLTGNVADADDLVQSTIERLLTRDQEAGQGTPAYVFTVCKNIWIDEVRKRNVRVAEEFEDSNHALTSSANSVSEQLEVKQVLEALQTLPLKSREILSMIAIAGFSYAEAAEHLKVPVGTIMSRVSRARFSLAEKLTKQIQNEAGGKHEIH